MVKGRLLAACSCLALCTLAQGAEEAPAAINWLRSMSEGAAAQRGTDKLLVVYLGGEHCPWCRKMEAETHADAKVISAMAKAVAVKPSGTDARALSSKYSIRGVPATLVLGPDGDLLTKVMGYRPPAAFLQALENAGTVYAEYVSAKTAAA